MCQKNRIRADCVCPGMDQKKPGHRVLIRSSNPPKEERERTEGGSAPSLAGLSGHTDGPPNQIRGDTLGEILPLSPHGSWTPECQNINKIGTQKRGAQNQCSHPRPHLEIWFSQCTRHLGIALQNKMNLRWRETKTLERARSHQQLSSPRHCSNYLRLS